MNTTYAKYQVSTGNADHKDFVSLAEAKSWATNRSYDFIYVCDVATGKPTDVFYMRVGSTKWVKR